MSENHLMISAPSKPTLEIDWVTPLKNLFKTAGVPQNFEPELAELNKLRNYVLAQSLEKSVASLEALQRYYDQVAALELKVPSDLIKNAEFSWHDAFDKGSYFSGRKSLTLPFIAFERLCVMFNIGALQSRLAADHRITDSDEDLKTSTKFFQSASGLFLHLSNIVTILPEEGLTPDLTPNSLTALSALMLAQAQEVFINKAIKDRMKDSIIAKLCIQAEDMYADALLKMTKDTLKYQWEKSWISIVGAKNLAYNGLAQYFQSRVCNMKKAVGEEIARLNLSLELIKKAQDKIGNSSLFSFYVTESTRLLTIVKKDNDFIYHEVVPSSSRLDPIEKVSSARLAKSTPVSEPLSPHFKDLFEKLGKITVSSKGKPIVEVDDNESANKNKSSTDLLTSPFKKIVDASLTAMGSYLLSYIEKQKAAQAQQGPK